MFGLKRLSPCCLNPNCRAQVKLSQAGYCAACAWALSQRNTLNDQLLENQIKADEIKHLNTCLAECEARGIELQESTHTNQTVMIEENIRLRASLIKACAKLRGLRSVS
jgi:hypothetical protein